MEKHQPHLVLEQEFGVWEEGGDPPTSGQCVKPSKLPVKTLRKELSEFGSQPLQTLHLPRASSVLSWLTRDAADGDGSGGSAGLSPEPGGSIPALPRQPHAKAREEENAPNAPILQGAARKPPGDARADGGRGSRGVRAWGSGSGFPLSPPSAARPSGSAWLPAAAVAGQRCWGDAGFVIFCPSWRGAEGLVPQLNPVPTSQGPG